MYKKQSNTKFDDGILTVFLNSKFEINCHWCPIFLSSINLDQDLHQP